jgi:hypothetical protein
VASSWSHAGYHLDRLAFYTVADSSRLYCADRAVKLRPRERYLASMPEGYPPLRQVVRRQLDGHPVTRQNPDVVLAHLAGQMGQYLVTFADLYLECSIPHTFDSSSINRDHIFFWNDVTSFPRVAHAAGLRNTCLDFEALLLLLRIPQKAL